ncbi:hypothetical protein ACFQ0M_19635 [Kitasatospora aburaviensis]
MLPAPTSAPASVLASDLASAFPGGFVGAAPPSAGRPGGVLLGRLSGGQVGLDGGHPVHRLDQLMAFEEGSGRGESGGDHQVADLGYLRLAAGGEADLPALLVRMALCAAAAGRVRPADVSGQTAEAELGRAEAGGLVT